MNRKSHGLSVSKGIPGFIQYKAAEALSPTTLRSYADDLKKWHDSTGDNEVTKVTTKDLRAFFIWLRTEYKPRRFDGNTVVLATSLIRQENWPVRDWKLWNSRGEGFQGMQRIGSLRIR
jgi:Phage integrase, N-terminal SAM-like domain